MDEDREVPDAMRDLVRRDGEGRHQTQREAGQKSGGDQYPIQRVMNAVADDDEDPRSGMRPMVVPVGTMIVAVMAVPVVATLGGTAVLLPMPVGMCVPPEHELLNDKEDPQPDQQSNANALSASRSNTFNRLRKKRQQRRTEQSPGRITDEVRQQPPAGGLRDQQEQSGECRAGDTADRGEENDPGEEGQGFALLFGWSGLG